MTEGEVGYSKSPYFSYVIKNSKILTPSPLGDQNISLVIIFKKFRPRPQMTLNIFYTTNEILNLSSIKCFHHQSI